MIRIPVEAGGSGMVYQREEVVMVEDPVGGSGQVRDRKKTKHSHIKGLAIGSDFQGIVIQINP